MFFNFNKFTFIALLTFAFKEGFTQQSIDFYIGSPKAIANSGNSKINVKGVSFPDIANVGLQYEFKPNWISQRPYNFIIAAKFDDLTYRVNDIENFLPASGSVTQSARYGTDALNLLQLGLGVSYPKMLSVGRYSLGTVAMINFTYFIPSKWYKEMPMGYVDSIFYRSSSRLLIRTDDLYIRKGIATPLYLGVVNSFDLSNRLAVLASAGLQIGFVPIFKENLSFITHPDTVKEHIESTTIVSRGTSWEIKLGLRYNFYR